MPILILHSDKYNLDDVENDGASERRETNLWSGLKCVPLLFPGVKLKLFGRR